MSDVYKLDIGIKESDREAIAQALSAVLADTYTLYLKTHNFHWNVVGPRFRDLHLMFEEQYTELAVAVDDIAERIRTLGFPAPGTYSQYAKLTAIEEVEDIPSAEEMVRILTEDNETVVRTLRSALKVVNEGDDESSASLVSDPMVIHEITAWMLRSLMGK